MATDFNFGVNFDPRPVPAQRPVPEAVQARQPVGESVEDELLEDDIERNQSNRSGISGDDSVREPDEIQLINLI